MGKALISCDSNVTIFPRDRSSELCKRCSMYVAGMKLLEQASTETLTVFNEGHHAVSQSGKPFSAVSSDMTLEQSDNGHS